MYIYSLSRIHNTNLTNASFGPDKRGCECLQLYIIYSLKPTTRAQCGLVGAKDCKCSRDQRFKCFPKHEGEYKSLKLIISFQTNIFGVFGPKTKSTIEHVQSIADSYEIPQLFAEPVETLNRNWSAINLYPHHIAYSQVNFGSNLLTNLQQDNCTVIFTKEFVFRFSLIS
jgi:hypothetical protein